ncbi:hypothetical protein QBC36DRAFT_98622 [Triangularia setosa]|uniref:Transmembrane protein n=1 Tax=Triangularia setosa TaxID=2587417 RepID=A0AAN6WCS4_9PEZI|nr:hypothetical protein QBC36DRAFT_98622 [Podospora setosa]
MQRFSNIYTLDPPHLKNSTYTRKPLREERNVVKSKACCLCAFFIGAICIHPHLFNFSFILCVFVLLLPLSSCVVMYFSATAEPTHLGT